ncbi:DNA replication licensing factor mcm10 [Diplogelasinospora grovesii]|uniref:DNA replication licensing factor mcm10 n=1 Tax=Diplogelasinospora grovesii TaxID=303347 RepID=A0AAN6NGX1_9PEZI|nr:DNA replication licensing factor mcm10 [Diplogelasinospora grovesii]
MASQWPPRSPHEALLSTPGGRERARRLAERGSPTPSPTKLRSVRSAAALRGRKEDSEDDLELDDDDDEEVLQLKLQAIQARLKLKKLQAAKAQKKKEAAGSQGSQETASDGQRPESAPGAAMGGIPLQSRLAAARDREERAISQNANAIQVPASPVRKTQPTANLQTSPQRVLLGIDKGRRAADMSLKRPPIMKKLAQEDRPNQQGGYLRRSNPTSRVQQQAEPPRPSSFNERLTSARAEELGREERRAKIQKLRTSAFAVGKQEMEEYKSKAADIPDEPLKPPEFSRDQIVSLGGGGLQRSNTVPSIRTSSQPADSSTQNTSTASTETLETEGAAFEPYSGLHLSKRILPHKVLTRAITGMKTYVLKDLLRHVKAPDWSLPDVESDIVVFAIIAKKSDPRAHQPKPGQDSTKPAKERGKYMIMTLVDLQFEVELYLFDSGFDRFWKLTPGTVLAILNPNIMPPPPGKEDTGRFGLVINNDSDTILEIGHSRDLGYCKSVKRDGQLCSSWVNARHTEHCEFHSNEAVRKARANRVELNSTFGSAAGSAGSKHHSNRSWKSGRGYNNNNTKSGEENNTRIGNYDRFTQSQYFVSRGAADLMDDEGIVNRVEKEEGLKRKLIQKEKEREIAKRLGEIGGGAGREYMTRAAAAAAATATASTSTNNTTTTQNTGTTADLLQKLGLGQNARNSGLTIERGNPHSVDLGRVKRKRPESAASSTTGTGTVTTNNGGTVGGGGTKTALGWGGNLRDKLAKMKDGERLDGTKGNSLSAGNMVASPMEGFLTRGDAGAGGRDSGTGGMGGTGTTTTTNKRDPSPVRKKTRFVTEKGIREAGRESLGEPMLSAAKFFRRRQVVTLGDDDDDDDDDDLIIVK